MKVTAAAKVGATVILAVIVILAIYKGMGWRIPGMPGRAVKGYKLYVSFSTVKGLNRGVDVLLNGNPVGEVDKIQNDWYGGVLVTLVIRGNQPIHEHAAFTISRENIFGSYKVTIDEQRSGRLIGPVRDGECEVRIQSGMVDVGGAVVKDGRTIGRIESVDRYEPRSDRVAMTLEPEVELAEDLVFVPYRPSGSLLRGLAVYGPLPPDSQVEGRREPGPEDLIADADKALIELTDQASHVIVEVTDLIGRLEELADPEEVGRLFDTLSAEVELIGESVERLTSELESLVAEAGPHVTQTLQNVEELSSEARDLMGGLAEYDDPELREAIREIVANLSDASDRLVDILDDLKQYTGDAGLRTEITTAVGEARTTLEEARGTLETAREAIGEASRTMDTVKRIEASGEFTLRYSPDPDRWAGDLDLQIGKEGGRLFLVGGVDDIGERERGNAQVGWRMTDTSSARLGVHRGKLGLGLDWRDEAVSLITDLYDPNDLNWDVYGGYAIQPELKVVVGVEDLLEEEELNFGLAYLF